MVGGLLGGDEGSGGVKLLHGANFCQQYALEDVVTPLLMGSLNCRCFSAIVRKLDFKQYRFALAAAPPKGLDHLL